MMKTNKLSLLLIINLFVEQQNLFSVEFQLLKDAELYLFSPLLCDFR